MKKIHLIIYSLLIAISLFLIPEKTKASILDWKTIETPHFTVFYPDGYQKLAEEALLYLETYRDKIKKQTGNDLYFKTHVVIQDAGLFSNGYAMLLNKKITLYTTTPPTNSFVDQSQSWLRFVSVHELTHREQGDNTGGLNKTFTNIFGNIFSPNLYLPLALIEGIAVYQESNITPFEGRLNDGYYDSIIATKAKNNDLPSFQAANCYHNHYPYAQWYFYGGAFTRYLAKTYGEKKLAEFFKIHGEKDNSWVFGLLLPIIGFDKSAKKVFGKEFTALFEDWKKYEIKKQKNWQTPTNPVSKTYNGKYSKILAYNNELYYFKETIPFSGPYLSNYKNRLIKFSPKTQKETILKTFLTESHSTICQYKDSLYYAIREPRFGYANIDQLGYGYSVNLYKYNLTTNQQEFLFQADIFAFQVLTDGSILYSTLKKGKFGSNLWLWQNRQKKKLHELDELISEIESWNNKTIVVSKPKLGSWNINYFNLKTLRFTPIINTPWTEKNIHIENDSLFYTANYNQKYEIYKLNLLNNAHYKYLGPDFMNQSYIFNNELFFSSIGQKGEALYKLAVKTTPYKIPKQEFIPELTMSQELKQKIKKDNALLNNFSTFWPHTRLPFLFLGEDSLGINHYGFYLNSLGSFDFYFSSKLLAPLTFNYLYYTNLNKKTHNQLSFNYPLYKTLNTPFAHSVDLKLLTSFENTSIGTDIAYGFPNQRGQFTFLRNMFSKGNLYNHFHSFLFDDSNLKISYLKAYKHDFIQNIRGYTINLIEDSSGEIISLDYTHKLLEIRNGIWNPNIFFGDLYGTVFTDSFKNTESFSAYGFELQTETSVATMPFITKLGYAITKDENIIYLAFGSDFTF